MTMFEKILHKEKNDLTEPDMPNRAELLKEIRSNNCREILSIGINLKILKEDDTLYPDKKEQIAQTVTMLKGKLKDLIIGCKYIDKQINEIAKGVKN